MIVAFYSGMLYLLLLLLHAVGAYVQCLVSVVDGATSVATARGRQIMQLTALLAAHTARIEATLVLDAKLFTFIWRHTAGAARCTHSLQV